MRSIQRVLIAPTLLVTASLVMMGCAASSAEEGSRATLYSEVTALAADSSAVVDVEVRSQEVVQDEIPYTLSTATVVTPFQPAGLSTNLSSPTAIESDEQLVIRQLGAGDEAHAPAPLLEVGERYLLFITPTMLEGDEGSQFYITGVSAGIYRFDSPGYVRVESDDPDTLPERLTAAELTG